MTATAVGHSEPQTMRWISVKERLPEGKFGVLVIGKRYMGLHEDRTEWWLRPVIAYYSNGWKNFGSGSQLADGLGVTHWMYLPEMPDEANR